MLFEKTLRKKKVPVFYLEILGYVLCVQAIFISTSIALGLCFNSILIAISLYLFGLVMTFVLFILSVSENSTFLHNFLLPIKLMRDKRGQHFKVQDILIVDYDLSYIEEYRTEDGFVFSYAYLFFAEPFIFIGDFVTLPVETEVEYKGPFHIFLQEINWTYRLHKAYRKEKEEWEKELLQERSMSGGFTRNYNKSKCDSFYLYITYSKRKLLNQLFELVNPPEFQITTYVESKVFVFIEPIPGKEYPPEALECMEKINAMYP